MTRKQKVMLWRIIAAVVIIIVLLIIHPENRLLAMVLYLIP